MKIDSTGLVFSVGGPPFALANSGSMTCWTYAADGTKLSRLSPYPSSPTLDYEGGSLKSILVDGGYIDCTAFQNGNPSFLLNGDSFVGSSVILSDSEESPYRYFVTDHQGNVRVVTDATGTALQVNHYDPFGNDLNSAPEGVSPYKYSGKEWDAQASLYDFSARMYSPALSRFTTIDPLAEKYYSISPYAYCANNPVNLMDPEGKEIWIFDEVLNEYVKYDNGSLYLLNGDEYNGNNSFVYDVSKALNELFSLGDDVISSVISTLVNSKRTHRAAYNKEYSDSVRPQGEMGPSLSNSGIPVGTWILLSLNTDTVDGVKYNSTTTIAHELQHSYDYDQGNMKGQVPWEGEGINPAEIRAVNFENRARARLRFPMRKKYGRTIIPSSQLDNPLK